MKLCVLIVVLASLVSGCASASDDPQPNEAEAATAPQTAALSGTADCLRESGVPVASRSASDDGVSVTQAGGEITFYPMLTIDGSSESIVAAFSNNAVRLNAMRSEEAASQAAAIYRPLAEEGGPGLVETAGTLVVLWDEAPNETDAATVAGCL
jgi:hypothetical protein